MKRSLAFIILFICFSITHAQQNFAFKGIVIDEASKTPLSHATVVSGDGKYHQFTNDSGVFVFSISEKKAELHISYLGYDSETIKINIVKGGYLTIPLKRSVSSLTEVDVVPDLPKYLFFGSKETEVIDYTFWMDQILVALFNYHTKRAYLILLDRNNNIIAELSVPASLEYVYQSCINKTYLILSDGDVFEVIRTSKGINIAPLNRETFYKKVVHYIGYHDKYFYLEDYSKSKQSKIFFLEDTEKKIIYNQSPFAYISKTKNEMNARRLASKIRADREMVIKKSEIIIDYDMTADGDLFQDFEIETKMGMEAKGRYKNMYMDHPIYAPLFINEQEIVVFNFVNDKMMKYDIETHFKDSTPISFHLNSSWNNVIYKDEYLSNYYTSFTNDQKKYALRKLDILTGKLSDSNLGIEYSNISTVKVHNGYVYYLHQPSPVLNNVFLFRQKID